MNNLTFGATLLSCFVMGVASLVTAIIWVPERTHNAMSGPEHVTARAANTTAAKDCSTVALAPATTRR